MAQSVWTGGSHHTGLAALPHENIHEIVSGKLELKEHEAARWLTKESLDSVDWLPADQALIEKIRLML